MALGRARHEGGHDWCYDEIGGCEVWSVERRMEVGSAWSQEGGGVVWKRGRRCKEGKACHACTLVLLHF